jgi:hypothetical protein
MQECNGTGHTVNTIFLDKSPQKVNNVINIDKDKAIQILKQLKGLERMIQEAIR